MSDPTPLAVCLESLSTASDDARFMQCVAIVGREPGLGLDAGGAVQWQMHAVPFELWISADNRLVLYRCAGAAPISVHRAGRSVDVPEAKPTFLLDQDELQLPDERLRVHNHGVAPGIVAPQPLAGPPSGGPGPIPVPVPPPIGGRDNPPSVPMPTPPPPIDIRDNPPAPMPPPHPPTPPVPIEIRSNPPAPPRIVPIPGPGGGGGLRLAILLCAAAASAALAWWVWR